MGANINDGPDFTYGTMAAIPSAATGFPVPDPNQDAGPNGEFQGDGVLDVRWIFLKDKVQGYTGVVPTHFSMPYLQTAQQIPAALATNAIATAQGVTSGVAMTLASAIVGVTLNVPIVPYGAGGITNGTVTTAAMALDFGFEFGNCTANTTTISVANNNDFTVGMPLVIGGVGNAGGTVPLLCNVASISTANTTQITLSTAPLATNATAPIGTGNIWGPNPAWYNAANQLPTAALPWLAGGPGLFLDPRQSITRGVSVTGASGGTGGTFVVRGWDIYGVPMTANIVVAAGSNTVYSTKAFKYIASVTPNFTDVSHNYTVGTSDMFGFNYRTGQWDNTDVIWNNTYMNNSQGFTAPTALGSASSATTGDVRGTVQTSGNGPLGSGIGSTASNGTVSSLAMSGVRLAVAQTIVLAASLAAFPATPAALYGVTQA